MYGGGFSLAFAQLLMFYYSAGCILHFLVPRVLPVISIQEHERRPGDVQRDCIQSLGAFHPILLPTQCSCFGLQPFHLGTCLAISQVCNACRVLCAGPIAVKAAVWAICEALHANKLSLLYTSSQPFAVHHVLYMVLCTLVLDYLHDTWFYWTHRLLHWKPLYRHVHCLHHRCASSTHAPQHIWLDFTGVCFLVGEGGLDT